MQADRTCIHKSATLKSHRAKLLFSMNRTVVISQAGESHSGPHCADFSFHFSYIEPPQIVVGYNFTEKMRRMVGKGKLVCELPEL